MKQSVWKTMTMAVATMLLAGAGTMAAETKAAAKTADGSVEVEFSLSQRQFTTRTQFLLNWGSEVTCSAGSLCQRLKRYNRRSAVCRLPGVTDAMRTYLKCDGIAERLGIEVAPN